MKIPFKYIVRSLLTRRLTTAITVVGISLVVFVFVAVLMMANGITQTLVATGSDDNVLIARKAANGEISSIITNDSYGVIAALPQVARDADGKSLITGDVVVIINLEKIGEEAGMSNVTVRGVSAPAFQLRPQTKIVDGRMFIEGAREVIVGSSIARRFRGAQVGGTVRFGGDNWLIVGMFDTGGNGFNSEIWGDVRQLQSAFSREGAYSTITFRLGSPDQLEAVKTAFEQDNRLQEFEVKSERQFFEDLSAFMSIFLSALGLFITSFFSVGAMIGAMITMYAAVANRTVEIGTLRALGFKRRSVLAAFLLESLIISIVGAAIGLFLASFLGFLQVSTMNFGSFSELEFSFALSTDIVLLAIAFALFMGFVGGFLPSIRAARLNIVNALRSA
ncbi:MAG: ABC transporter permease [Bacteroidota bacterium]